MRFDHDNVSSIMPPDTKYVSIIREPLAHFESSFDFFYDKIPSFQQVEHNRSSLEPWLDHADEYVRNAPRQSHTDMEKNLLFFDFGLENRNDDMDYIDRSISEIDKVFHLIMISDYMDESLVLLGDLMCWDVEELACLKLNARSPGKPRDDVELKRIREKARKWNKADAALYDYFNETFWRKVQLFGIDKMKYQKDKLNKASVKLKHLCLDTHDNVELSQIKNEAIRNDIFNPEGVTMTGFDLKLEAESLKQCRRLIAPEKLLCKEVFDLQNNPINKTHFIAESTYIDPMEEGFSSC